jgi:hypothetical protein
MILAWSASSFCFYILGFYVKYIPGDIFINTIILALADSVSSACTGLIASSIGAGLTMTLAFGVSFLGGISLIFVNKDSILITALILVTKFGINISFTLCYIINAEYFPSVVSSRIFGICNIFSRISTILSPLIAELKAPIPMVVYSLVCLINMVCSMFLKRND